jgi:large subunit ribosomal protein L9
MKVLLRDHVEKLGDRGQIVDVAAGYARNFLLPRHLAVVASEANQRQLDLERARIAQAEAAEREETRALVQKLESTSATVIAAASPEGHLYGSVGPDQVAVALQRDGLDIRPGDVKMDEHLKEVGVFLVSVRLRGGLSARIRVWVVAE